MRDPDGEIHFSRRWSPRSLPLFVLIVAALSCVAGLAAFPGRHPHELYATCMSREQEDLRNLYRTAEIAFDEAPIQAWSSWAPKTQLAIEYRFPSHGKYQIAPAVVGRKWASLRPKEIVFENVDPLARVTAVRASGETVLVPYEPPAPGLKLFAQSLALGLFSLPFGALWAARKQFVSVPVAITIAGFNGFMFPAWFTAIPETNAMWAEKSTEIARWVVAMLVIGVSLVVLIKGRAKARLVS